jgi:hypothetical protein
LSAVAKHHPRAIERPIADQALNTGIAVTALSQSGLFDVTARIVQRQASKCPLPLGARCRRVVTRRLAWGASQAPRLSRLLWRCPCNQALWKAALREQCGENHPTNSWQGGEDRSGGLLVCLPRAPLLRLVQGAAQPVHLAVRILELAVDHCQAFGEHANVSVRGPDRSGATVIAGFLRTVNTSAAVRWRIRRLLRVLAMLV